jgi:hypothetical protein
MSHDHDSVIRLERCSAKAGLSLHTFGVSRHLRHIHIKGTFLRRKAVSRTARQDHALLQSSTTAICPWANIKLWPCVRMLLWAKMTHLYLVALTSGVIWCHPYLLKECVFLTQPRLSCNTDSLRLDVSSVSPYLVKEYLVITMTCLMPSETDHNPEPRSFAEICLAAPAKVPTYCCHAADRPTELLLAVTPSCSTGEGPHLYHTVSKEKGNR